MISPEELKAALPLSDEYVKKRVETVACIENILTGKDARKLFIVGPCSADDPTAVCEFACKLSEVADKVKDEIFTVMRVFTAKPRTRGEGYMGIIHARDMNDGLYAMRKLHIDVIKESGLFTADELLYTDLYAYIDDVVSYMTIGARSAEDQMHRFVAGGADIPIGIKNPLNGNPYDHADCIHAASISSEFMLGGKQVSVGGNKFAHAVFRGGIDRYGKNFSNYSRNDAECALRIFRERGVNTSAIIDTGHSNSDKDPSRVESIVYDVLDYTKKSRDADRFIKGFMIESYLFGGCKNHGSCGYGISVTDPCLGFAETERIMLRAADILRRYVE